MVEKTEVCKTCILWEWVDGQEGEVGRCHRYAPRPVAGNTKNIWEFPLTKKYGWCGDYKKETP